jgi:FixJ family two-component response regulator
MPPPRGLARATGASMSSTTICVPTMLIGGRLDAAIAERAGNLGVIATLEKPLGEARLVELVRAGLEEPR